MRTCVRQFLNAAVEHLDLAGPAALIAGADEDRESLHWMRSQFAGQMSLECRTPPRAAPDADIELGSLPIAPDSIRTLICLDLVSRFDETAELLMLALPLLAPGGMALVAADIGQSRPQIGMSRVLTPLGLERLVANLDAAIVGWQGDVDFPSSLFLVTCRAPVPTRFAHSAGQFIEAFQRSLTAAEPQIPWLTRAWRKLERRVMARERATTPRPSESSFSLHLPHSADWKAALLNRPRREAADDGARSDAA